MESRIQQAAPDQEARLATIWRFERGREFQSKQDELAVEEPLEIRVEGRGIAVVMRTPGDDRELAAGFLLAEGIVKNTRDIFQISSCGLAEGETSNGNIIDVLLTNPQSVDFAKLTRHVLTSSSCGICSKASIDAVRQQFSPIESDFIISAETLLQLPAKLAAAQQTFQRTGGLHACALFDQKSDLTASREDVGRHNALDKLSGWALLENHLPLRESVLLLSGRVSFEMMQKALAAGIPIVAAISAPTSAAVEFANESAQTLVGFLRGESMNIYAGSERIRHE